ncbi:MAG: hypothetical protein SYC29_05980 [Planctomycetota bacterium]|nr:hypothetical protein [Planctomycetota bacterium]
MSEHPISDDELMVVDERLRAEAEAWRRDPPADLHERTMRALARVAADEHAAGDAPSGGLGRVPHGLALAAACLALLITTWAALVLQGPLGGVEAPTPAGDHGEIAKTLSDDRESQGEVTPAETSTPPAAPPVLSDILAAASLESEIAALETDARTLSSMMTRQVRLISGRERQ